MNSLAGYGSDDDDNERYDQRQPSVSSSGGNKGQDIDGTNYEAVNMDMSEDSEEESEPELPQAEPESPKQPARDDRRDPDNRRNDEDRVRGRDDRDRDRSDRGRSERDRSRDDRDRRDDRYNRGDRSDRDRRPDRGAPPKRGLLGDRPDQKETKIQSLLDVKPFAGDNPHTSSGSSSTKSYDARDAVSPRFVDRDRERERDRDRDRDRHCHRSDDRRGDRHRHDRQSRSRDRSERSKSRGHAYPPPEMHPSSSSNDRRGSPPTGEYKPSYKVNKKLEVMEKMGLQIKRPDGSMATAQELRQAACESGPPTSSHQLPSYYNPSAVNANKILNQVQKRKLLWSNKKAEAPEEAAKWSGTRFAQDNDGKQTNKFMRLMGIKDPAAVVKPDVPAADPIKKQEELFQAMQAQYEVARATTHTMRGVGLGFQRGPI